MVNPSIDGLVKIGKTTREPESRANELSQATGVATPFYVAFSICVPDCHAAEKFVHAILDHNGFRQTPNREFFQIPLRKAIEILMLTEKELEDTKLPETENATGDEFGTEYKNHPSREIFEQAVLIYTGKRGELEDKDEALQFLERAKSLNFPAAFTALSQHFLNEADNAEDLNEVEANITKAMAVLKEGGRRGHGRCWVMLADIYHRRPSGVDWEWKSAAENANKCWRKYFTSATFINDEDERWTQNLGDLVVSDFDEGTSRLIHTWVYLKSYVANLWMEMDEQIKPLLNPLKEELIEFLNESIARDEKCNNSELAHQDQKLLEFIQKNLT